MPIQKFAPMTKDFPTFDCDAHVTEPPWIWERAKDWLTKDELEALAPAHAGRLWSPRKKDPVRYEPGLPSTGEIATTAEAASHTGVEEPVMRIEDLMS